MGGDSVREPLREFIKSWERCSFFFFFLPRFPCMKCYRINERECLNGIGAFGGYEAVDVKPPGVLEDQYR